jgi:hypothetical protein
MWRRIILLLGGECSLLGDVGGDPVEDGVDAADDGGAFLWLLLGGDFGVLVETTGLCGIMDDEAA